MKLAEALQERADLNRRIQQLQQRLENNAMVQEGELARRGPGGAVGRAGRLRR